jgi:hypothetical protein
VEVHERGVLSRIILGVSLREIGLKILFAIVAGLIAGVFDLWVYEFSWRGFVAGLVAGVAYFLVVLFLFVRGMERFPLILFAVATIAGTVAATAWWLVCRGAPLWMAIAAGIVLAWAHFASQGFFASRRY